MEHNFSETRQEYGYISFFFQTESYNYISLNALIDDVQNSTNQL